MKIIKRILTGILFAALFVFGFWFVTKTDFGFLTKLNFSSVLFIYFVLLFFFAGTNINEY